MLGLRLHRMTSPWLILASFPRLGFWLGLSACLLAGIVDADTPPMQEDQPTVCSPDRPAPGLMSLDPRQDGWSSEYVNEVVSRRLQVLAEYLQNHDERLLRELSGGASRSTKLVPNSLQPAFATQAMRYYRVANWTNPQGPSSEQTGIGTALAELFLNAAEPNEIHAKFKVIRIAGSPENPESRQLVSLSFRDREDICEVHTVWDIKWDFSSGPDHANILSLTGSDFELVRWHLPMGNMFSDESETVFRYEPGIWHDHLGVGIGDWVRRLEGFMEVYQYGHNGIALGDVNGDGLDDLYVCQTGGLPNRLLIAQRDGSVRDRVPQSGVDFLDNTQSALLVDLDNDADQDLILSLSRAILILKNNGEGVFEIVAELPQARLAYSLAATDFDQDRDLDVYVCVYYAEKQTASELPIPMPIHDAKNGGRNILFRNDGGFTFRDVTDEVGLDVNNSRFSYAAVWDDFDNDGDDDLYVANDFGRNNYYRNDGGKFVETTAEIGLNDNTFGMSAASSDFDRNGWIDIYKANMFSSAGNRITHQPQFMPNAKADDREIYQQLANGNSLFINRNGSFEDVAAPLGVHMGRWSWGSIFLDLNNDGWDDLYVTNGFITGPQKDDL